jgi:hypothetical protein
MHLRGNISRLRGAAALMLSALALAAAWPALAAPPDNPGTPPPPPPPAKQVKSRAAEDAKVLDCLPETYLRPDGSVDHAALVAHEKKRVEVINARLGTHLRVTETPHYLVCCDGDTTTTAQFVRWCEALYTSLGGLFGIEAHERVWDGKCMLFLFTRRAKFEECSCTLDKHDSARAGAYFAVEDYGVGHPKLVKICLPLDEREPRRLQELFAHEGTHAFFEFYRKPGRLPLWLHEGLAEYMTTVNNPALGPEKSQKAALAAGDRGDLVRRLFAAQTGQNLKTAEYAAAFSLVDFLIADGKTKFKKFVEGLKDGKPQEESLAAAYGFGLRELEKRWRAWLTAPTGK